MAAASITHISSSCSTQSSPEAAPSQPNMWIMYISFLVNNHLLLPLLITYISTCYPHFWHIDSISRCIFLFLSTIWAHYIYCPFCFFCFVLSATNGRLHSHWSILFKFQVQPKVGWHSQSAGPCFDRPLVINHLVAVQPKVGWLGMNS